MPSPNFNDNGRKIDYPIDMFDAGCGRSCNRYT